MNRRSFFSTAGVLAAGITAGVALPKKALTKTPWGAYWNPEYLDARYEASLLNQQGKVVQNAMAKFPGIILLRGNIIADGGYKLLSIDPFCNERGEPARPPMWFDLRFAFDDRSFCTFPPAIAREG